MLITSLIFLVIGLCLLGFSFYAHSHCQKKEPSKKQKYQATSITASDAYYIWQSKSDVEVEKAIDRAMKTIRSKIEKWDESPEANLYFLGTDKYKHQVDEAFKANGFHTSWSSDQRILTVKWDRSEPPQNNFIRE